MSEKREPIKPDALEEFATYEVVHRTRGTFTWRCRRQEDGLLCGTAISGPRRDAILALSASICKFFTPPPTK